MNEPAHFPTALYLYFAAGGTTALILFALVTWTWLRTRAVTSGRLRSGLTWLGVGFAFLLSSQWFACGIGAGPGFLLGDDDSARQPFLATAAAVAGMFCSVIGWFGVLVGMRFIHTSLKQGVTRPAQTPTPTRSRRSQHARVTRNRRHPRQSQMAPSGVGRGARPHAVRIGSLVFGGVTRDRLTARMDAWLIRAPA